MKVCSKCGQLKDNTEFYKDKRGKLGIYAACRNCHNKVIMSGYKYILNNRKKQNKYRLIKQNQLKIKARTLARKALTDGLLKINGCRDCNNPKFELHHPNYSYPLEVIALCKQHHADIHYDYTYEKENL